jgi:hypothetical protein
MTAIGRLFDVECTAMGRPPEQRLLIRQRAARPLINDLAPFLDASLSTISGRSELAKAIRYARSRWVALTRYLDDGTLEISNNAAERAIRPLALGRKNYLFAGSDSGGERAAAMYTLIETALCRARHKAVYAEHRTMPNTLVFPGDPEYSCISSRARVMGKE